MARSAPNLIADVKADCVRGEDGVWRYQSQSVLPIFVGSDMPLALAVDPQIRADIKHSTAVQPFNGREDFAAELLKRDVEAATAQWSARPAGRGE